MFEEAGAEMTHAETKGLLEELEREWGGVRIDASGRDKGRVVLTPARALPPSSGKQPYPAAASSDEWEAATDGLNRRFWAIYDMFRVHGIAVDPPPQPRPTDMPVRTAP